MWDDQGVKKTKTNKSTNTKVKPKQKQKARTIKLDSNKSQESGHVFRKGYFLIL
jgi:hypothetical protein